MSDHDDNDLDEQLRQRLHGLMDRAARPVPALPRRLGRRMQSLLVLATAVGIVAVIAASLGISSHLRASGVGSSGPSLSASPQTPRATLSATAAVTPTASAPGAVANCSAAQLTVSGGPAGGAAGTTGAILTFTNSSAQACQLVGYPVVVGLNSQGTAVVTATPATDGTSVGTAGPAPVVLQPRGDVASALVLVDSFNPPAGAVPCGTLSSLSVTPPGTDHAFRVTLMLPDCPNLRVLTIVAGAQGMATPAGS